MSKILIFKFFCVKCIWTSLVYYDDIMLKFDDYKYAKEAFYCSFCEIFFPFPFKWFRVAVFELSFLSLRFFSTSVLWKYHFNINCLVKLLISSLYVTSSLPRLIWCFCSHTLRSCLNFYDFKLFYIVLLFKKKLSTLFY